MINLFNYLLISNIFAGAFYFPTSHFQFYFSYVFMILFLVYCIFYRRKLYISKSYVVVLTVMSLLSLLNIYLGNDSLPSFLKQFIGFVFNGIVYYTLIKLNDNKIEKLFKIYLQLALVIGGIAIFQEISFLIGFKHGYDYSYLNPFIRPGGSVWGMLRVTSILQEPAHFGASMMPAVFISFLNILKWEENFIDKKASLLIILSVLLTFSLVVYVGMTCAFILIMLNHRKKLLFAICTVILFIFMIGVYQYVPGIKMRITDTIDVMSGKKPVDVYKVNVSSFTFYTNGIVAIKSFMNDPLFGSGIGSHPISHDRYIKKHQVRSKGDLFLCKEDAGSLFFRLISETGLLGTCLFFYFILRFYVSRNKDKQLWMISNAILCIFIMSLIRNGNYFYCGFIFFMGAYYFTYKNVGMKSDHLPG